ncbi:hypothetical protein CRYUN_Cryun10bG0076400 [Craigia yunnanensis]
MFLVLFICFSLESHVSFGADTISSNQSISGNLAVVSAGGVFQLGFFRPGKSSNYYIGIWYKRVSQLTTVWVANREKPIRDIYSSVLKISDGNLILFNESRVPIWSTNVRSTNSSSVVALLLDDGNLVLRDGPNSTKIFWQSFDHPTDTWLPGSKLRLDKRTNQSQSFTSWKSLDDPAPAMFPYFEHTNDEDGTFFPTCVARQVNEGADVLKLLDSRLNGNANLEELSRLCKVACWCIQDDEIQRPSMGQVVQILEGFLDVSLPPIPRFLQAFNNDQERIFFFIDSPLSVSAKAEAML